MNQHRYRIVFNRTRGQMMAVAECASSHGRGRQAAEKVSPGGTPPGGGFFAPVRRPLAGLLSFVMAAQPMLQPIAAYAQIVVDRSAPTGQQPTLTATGNGVPVVNIQTPSTGGVSYNRYTQFDVQQNGAILNNARCDNAKTELGGWVPPNPWLVGSSARIIVNEVNSSNPSLLRGYLEVAGDRAQVIVANPSGITCDGCGFINANRATLTTGTPVMNGGSLDGYVVRQGKVTIAGDGLDATRADYTDIIARAVEVNAGLWANTLKVTTGANQVDAGNTHASPIAGSGAAPGYAIDVAALGGMYAGKITLIGTEAGVGVRNAGDIGALAGDVVVDVNGQLANRGTTYAAQALSVKASGIENRGLIDGADTRLEAGQIDNLASGKIYGNHLAIAADTLNNLAESGNSPVIGARDRLDLAVGTLNNREHALIYSAGDMAIGHTLDANNRATGRAGTLNNASATIEALGDLSLAADTVNNTNEHFSTTVASLPTQSITEYQGAGSGIRYLPGTPGVYVHNDESDQLMTPEGNYESWYAYNYTRSTTETRIASTDPGKILVGGNLHLDTGPVTNDKSQIVVGGTIDGSTANVTNPIVEGQRTVTDSGTSTAYWRDHQKGQDSTGSSSSAYRPAATVTPINLGATTYQQSTTPTGTGTRVDPSNGVNLSGNSLYTVAGNPNAGYLVASDPRLTDYRTWISSDAMLAALGANPATMQKRLGDGFLEQKLLREQIAQLTGRRFLGNFTNDEAQYLALMDAGVTFAKGQNLVPGVALTAEQVARLTSDIVWLVEKDVTLPDGSHARALVPQVYVQVRPGDIDGTGSLISANAINLNIGGDLENGGTIAGRQLVSLNAQNLKNLGGRIVGASVDLDASGDIQNLGGTVEAQDSLSLRAGGDIEVASTTNTQTSSQGERTNLGRLAGLYVTGEAGTLQAIAGKNAKFDGAEIVNAGSGPILLAAVGNLSLGTVTESNRQDIVWDGRNYLKQASSSEVGTRVSSGGDVTLLAGENLTARAVAIQAKGDLSAVAGGDLVVEAGRSTATLDASSYHEDKNKFTGRRRADIGRWQEATTDIQSASLSGKNVTLQSGGSLILEAAKVAAREKLAASATGDVQILSAEQTRVANSRVRTEKGDFGNVGRKSWQTDVDALKVHQVGSALSGAEVAVQAGNNLVVQASSVKSDGKLKLDADRQILVIAATEVDERHEKTEYKNNRLGSSTHTDYLTGRNGLQNSLGLVTHRSFESPGRIVKSLNTNDDSANRKAARSTLEGTAITSRSGSDTTFEAPVIKGETLTVRAGVDKDGQVVDEYARINLIGVKESRQQGDGHDQHASFWDNIANTGSYKESLLMPEFHLSGRNEDGTQTKADLAAPGGYTVGAIALAPTQYEIRKAQEEAEARARAEAEKAAELARLRGEPTIAPTITPTIGKTRTDSDKDAPPASAVQATVATVREKAKTIVPDPVWTCTGVIEKQCAWVTPPDLTLRTRAESLAKTPGLEWLADIAKRDDVDWQKVELAAQNWDYKHAGLTKEGAAVVVIVVTILTWGAASSAGTAVAQGAGMTTGTVGASGATLTATGSAVAAGVAAGITTIASQAAVSLINNHGDIGQTLNDLGSSENVKQVVAAMLTAGLAKGVTQAVNLPVTGANATFMTRFANYSAQAAVSAGVKSLVFGTPLKESAKEALVTSLAQSLTAEVGDWAKDNQIPAGSLEKMLAHAVVQCAAASVMRQDCGSAALGAAIAEALSPISDKLDQTDYSKRNQLNGKLGNAIASMSAMLVADLTGKNTMTASAAAGMVDSYNRQLHPSETQRIKQLANGDAKKEARLTAAACAIVHCADGVPISDPNYAYLKGLQDAGAGMAAEQALLSQQQGWVGRNYQTLFQYGGVDAGLDYLSQNKVGTRLAGAAQGTAGVLGVAGSAALCTSGIGCAAGAVTGTVSADYAQAGVKQAWTGNSTTTYGEQVLQSLGLSPTAAAYTYAALGIAPAGLPALGQAIAKVAPQLDALAMNAGAKLGQNVDDLAGSLASSSTKTTGTADRVVLGKWQGDYAGYVGEAKLNGGTWYQTDEGVFEKMTAGLSRDEQLAVAWKVNESFLTQQLQKGVARFDMTGVSIADIKAGPTTTFAYMEVQFLEANAAQYGYQQIGNSWVKVRP